MKYSYLVILLVLTACGPSYYDRLAQQQSQQMDKIVAQDTARLRAAGQRDDEIAKKIDDVGKACNLKGHAQRPYDYTFYSKCSAGPTLAILKSYNVPDIDVWELKLKKEAAVLEQLQRHEITKTQAEAELSEIKIEIKNIFDERIQSQHQQHREFLQDINAAEQRMDAHAPINCSSSTSGSFTHTTCY